jgi:hypothetical protein
MRAASSRICFTIPNSQQTNHPNPTDKTDQLNKLKSGPTEPSKFDHRSTTDHAQFRSDSRKVLVEGYTRLLTDRVSAGWSCHLVTIMFSQLPGPRTAVISRMRDEVQRVYSTLVTRVQRKPRTAPTDELPVLVGAIDLPVYKHDRYRPRTFFVMVGFTSTS